jgi:hypothetical protein
VVLADEVQKVPRAAPSLTPVTIAMSKVEASSASRAGKLKLTGVSSWSASKHVFTCRRVIHGVYVDGDSVVDNTLRA